MFYAFAKNSFEIIFDSVKVEIHFKLLMKMLFLTFFTRIPPNFKWNNLKKKHLN